MAEFIALLLIIVKRNLVHESTKAHPGHGGIKKIIRHLNIEGGRS